MSTKLARPAVQEVLHSGITSLRQTDWTRLLLTNRTVQMVVLLVVVVSTFSILSATGVIGDYNADYLAFSAINLVPVGMLALAQLVVIVSETGTMSAA